MFTKGHATWNKGKTHLVGENNPMYGEKHTRQALEKMVAANIGSKDSEETLKKKSVSHKGLNPADWGAGFKIGSIPWNKNPTQIAYFAGLIDGEGSIGISNNGKSTIYPDKKYKRVSVRVAMVGAKEVLEEGQKRWGGYVVKRKRHNINPNWSDFNEWILQHGDAEKLLKAIKPFLKIKKRQAEICIRYRLLQTRKKLSDGAGGTPFITEAEAVIRDELEKELVSLHLKKGNRAVI